MAQTPVKLGTFKDLMLDRQIEELVTYARQTADNIPAAAICAPTTITALTTAGGFGHVRLEYSYTAYTGHKYTQIWRSDDNDFANAERAGESAAHFHQDFPASPSISDVFYYWVRNENLDGDEGDLFGPVAGSVGSDPDYNLEILLEQLGFGHFQDGTYPIRTEPTFPTLPSTNYPVGTIIYLTTNQLLYKNVNEAWEPVMAAEDMVGEIVGTQIAEDEIGTPHLKALCVTADEMAANSIIAGKIAAGALVVDDGVMQNAYVKNAHIADCSVAKLIAGIITAGDIYLGADSNIHLDGANQQITVNDGTYDRVTLGKIGGDWGMEIRDASNNVILNSGGVQASMVSGLGNMALIDQITAGNISSYIAGLAVDTLFIAENAVTVPIYTYGATETSGGPIQYTEAQGGTPIYTSGPIIAASFWTDQPTLFWGDARFTLTGHSGGSSSWGTYDFELGLRDVSTGAWLFTLHEWRDYLSYSTYQDAGSYVRKIESPSFGRVSGYSGSRNIRVCFRVTRDTSKPYNQDFWIDTYSFSAGHSFVSMSCRR